MDKIKEWTMGHKKILFGVLGAAVLALLCWGGFSIYARHAAVKAADGQMEKASDLLSQVLLEDDGQADVSGNDLAEGMISLKDADVKYAAGLEAHETDPYMGNRIDIAKLRTIVESEDVYGWLTIPDTEIDYVVMQGTDEEPTKYLWQDMYGEPSKTGCLFIQGALGSGRDDHTIIYGHRLKNHALFFGPLLQYRDGDHAEAHKYAYTYDDQKVTKWELAYVCEGKEDDPVYFFPYEKGTDDWKYLDEYLAGKASYSNGSIGENDDMLVLSTCSGRNAGTPQRLYLAYRDVAYYLY